MNRTFAHLPSIINQANTCTCYSLSIGVREIRPGQLVGLCADVHVEQLVNPRVLISFGGRGQMEEQSSLVPM